MRSIAFTYLCEVLVLLHAWSYLLQIGMDTLLALTFGDKFAVNTILPSLGAHSIGLIGITDDELAVEQVKGKVNYAICIANR